MPSILDPGEERSSREDLAAVQENAWFRLRTWRRRSLYALAALGVGCAAVVPFSAGNPLHDYAEPFGRMLVCLTLAAFIASLYCCLLWCGAWAALRDLRRG